MPRFFMPEENPNKSCGEGVLELDVIFSHTLVFNLSLTHGFQTLDRISRYFKAKFSALIR
jgi:hypothetical protein